jgi:N-dimethylarginine dimethylaminohydrolase
VSTGIGTFYVGQASRTAQARVHRYLADQLEHEAELEAVRADAAQEARIS